MEATVALEEVWGALKERPLWAPIESLGEGLPSGMVFRIVKNRMFFPKAYMDVFMTPRNPRRGTAGPKNHSRGGTLTPAYQDELDRVLPLRD
jgi:hypothetical protein